MNRRKPKLPDMQTIVEETLKGPLTTDERTLFDRKERRLQGDMSDLKKKYNHVLDLLQKNEMELAAILDIKADTGTFAIKPHYGTNTSEPTAVVLASDWHIEEEVKPQKVINLNRFNLAIANQRAVEFFQRIVRFTRKEQQDVKIKDLVLFLGGDFISGNIHEELKDTCLLHPVEAIQMARKILESGITFLLNNTKLSFT
ncbi:hypothetical protein L0Y69_00775, partial [bacterium]|nr:hypothetical protein [bacterium]